MKVALALAIAVLFASCTRNKGTITKIEFATSECFIPCKHVAISIDSSLKYQFKEVSTQAEDNFVGKADKRLWGELVDNILDIDYKHIDTLKKTVPSDVQMAELIVYEDGNKPVRFYTEYGAESKIGQFMKLLAASPSRVKLRETNDTLHFGTTLQNPRNRD